MDVPHAGDVGLKAKDDTTSVERFPMMLIAMALEEEKPMRS